MRIARRERSAYYIGATTALLGVACGSAPDPSGQPPQSAEVQQLDESIGVATSGPNGRPSVAWQHFPRGTIQKMIEAREQASLGLEPLPTASVVQQCDSTGGAGDPVLNCTACWADDLWIFDAKWDNLGIKPTKLICLRTTPWPWDYLPGIPGPGGTWGQLAESVWGPTNSTARFDCGAEVVDPRDNLSKVMFFVNGDERVNIPCGDDGFLTTWTRIPWG